MRLTNISLPFIDKLCCLGVVVVVVLLLLVLNKAEYLFLLNQYFPVLFTSYTFVNLLR
jgi:hypothetical protein